MSDAQPANADPPAVTAEQLKALVDEHDDGGSVRDALNDALEEHGEKWEEDEFGERKPDQVEPEEPAKEGVEAVADEKKAKADDKTEIDDALAKEKAKDADKDTAKDADKDDKPDPDSEAAAKPPEDDDQDKTDQKAKDSDEEDAPPGSLTPPGSWSAEERAEFSDLPEKVQAAVLRREGDRDRGFSRKQAELSEKSKRYDAFDAVIEPYKDNFALHGIDPANLFNQYIAIDKSMTADPVGTLRMLAERAGVDLSSLNPEAAGETPNPELAELRRELNETRQQVSSFQTRQEQTLATEQEQRQTALQGQLEAFAGETDESNNLKYPHFEELRATMGVLISSGGAKDLDAAYSQALWASPNHREALLTTQRRDTERAAEKGKKAHAAKAAKAGKSVAGSPGGAEPPGPVGTIREELEKAAAAESL